MYKTVGIAEMKVSNTQSDVLVTYSLGSCIGLSVYDPVAGVGGLLHYMLPVSKVDPMKAKANPSMFGDTGVPALLQAVFDLGATKKNLITKVVGGASLLAHKNLFKIGERNYTVLRKIFLKNDISISAKDVGGTCSRTVFLYMATGITVVKSRNKEMEL